MQWMRDYFLKEGPGIPKDAPKKTGLALFVDILGREWWELVKLNLLFILFSLPLVTLPAAQVAATRICVAMVEDRNCYLWRDFWETFRARFVAATLAGISLGVAFGVTGFALAAYVRAAAQNLAFSLPLAVALVVLALVPLLAAHLFALLAMSRLPLSRLLPVACLGLLARPLPGLAAMGFVAALWLLHVLLYPASILMPAVLNFSVGTLAMTFGVHKMAVRLLSLAEARKARPPETLRHVAHANQKGIEMSGKWLHTSFALAAGLALLAADARSGTVVAQSAEPVTLKWALWDWNAVAYYEPLIEAYQAKHPNVKIEYVDLGSTDYQTILQTQLTGGADDLDLVSIKDVPSYANLMRAGLLYDLSESAAKNKLDPAPYGGLIEELTVDGKLYTLPFSSNFWLTYYNKDLFDAAGVAYPSNDMTLAQFDELARKVTSGMGPNKVNGTLFHVWRSTVQLPCILDGEHTVIDGDYGFLKPCYERALALQEDAVVPSYASLKTSSTHYSAPFYNSKIAMLPMGSWFIATQIAKVKSGESKSTNWGLVKFPHPEGVHAGTTAAQLTGIAVNANSAHKAQAADFANFISGPEGAKIVAATGTIPAFRTGSVIDSIASVDGFPKDANSRQALETVKTYLEMPVTPLAAKIEVVLNRAHDSIMTDNVTIDEGIEEMNEGVKAIQ